MMESVFKNIEALLHGVAGKALSPHERIEQSIALTSFLVEATLYEKTRDEKKYEAWMARMMEDVQGRTFMTAMTDECFRSCSAKRVADQISYLLKKFGIPQFLDKTDRVKFFIFRLLGNHLPHIFVPLIGKQIKHEASRVLLPQDPQQQKAYFEKCRQKNIRVNLNHLGEAILGEIEAKKRLEIYLNDLANPQIEYISIKISSIYSQINHIGYKKSLEILSDRLRLLYRAAKENLFKQANGVEIKKFVNLDMEEFRDLDLTIDLFQKVLSEPEFLEFQAGIVLQSYLPNSFVALQQLTKWAQQRVKQGGSPIKIRLVKGANLAMEYVESSMRGWEIATFEQKLESDANFKKMLEFSCQYENAKVAHIGVGSHNLFDIALALILRAEHKTEEWVTFEMLEGMALPMQQVIKKITGSLLLYCPEAKEKDFHSAVAYLIRRLDENGGPENFLRHFYKIMPHNSSFQEQAIAFSRAYQQIEILPTRRKRTQNRLLEPTRETKTHIFHNEPDTDFSLIENRQWAEAIFDEWKTKKQSEIPLVIDGKEIFANTCQGIDPSCPQEKSYSYSIADVPLVEKAVVSAAEFENIWANTPFEERFKLMGEAAFCFKKNRGTLIGAMIADGGKTIWEADPEVSEAIDFIEYYRRNWEQFLQQSHIKWRPKGTILVAPPWNFPCSIPVGGIAAALIAGNCVLFKPAPEAALVGWYVAKTFWEAGIPKKALQFINCKDDPVGTHLVKSNQVASIVLTGGTQTAHTFLQLRPGLDLHAEAGGKNSMIVTAMADRDLAVRDIIHSAFSHSGQKCSACSVLILESEVYDDPRFKNQLFDAAQSLVVDSAWNPNARITPLIRVPDKNLLRGLTSLEEGESWLLKPQVDLHNPQLWSPGIKWGVEKNSFTHQTELFGPILAVMRAQSLADAITIANSTPYGLTSGLHSLDEREHHYWKKRIIAGNLYINRSITGAIVQRQPFGGCKSSSFGPGAKAGGPNYVAQLAIADQIDLPAEKAPIPAVLTPLVSNLTRFNLSSQEEEIWIRSAKNYAYWAPLLKQPQDPTQLRGQNNFFYLVSRDKCSLRLEQDPNMLPLLQVIAACLICKTPLEISTPLPLPRALYIPTLSIHIEDQKTFLQRKPRQIRLLASPSQSLKEESAAIGATLNASPPLIYGRIELLHYLREISLSIDTHRYGYLPPSP